MAGYLNRVINKQWPELAGVEDPDDPNSRSIIWLTVRNPRLMSGGELMSGGGSQVVRQADGSVMVEGGGVENLYATVAKMIIGGNVLDPTSDEDDQPPLPMPPSADDVSKFPIEILNWLGDLVNDNVPR